MSTNVISILSKKSENKTKVLEENTDIKTIDFETIIQANQIKKDKEELERQKKNRSVLRTFKLKK